MPNAEAFAAIRFAAHIRALCQEAAVPSFCGLLARLSAEVYIASYPLHGCRRRAIYINGK
jgi:hypothetical protein